MDHLLISNSRYIRLANEHGLAKMNRNILALQQNLKNIGDEPLEVNFDRSRTFWEVFGRGPSVCVYFQCTNRANGCAGHDRVDSKEANLV